MIWFGIIILGALWWWSTSKRFDGLAAELEKGLEEVDRMLLRLSQTLLEMLRDVKELGITDDFGEGVPFREGGSIREKGAVAARVLLRIETIGKLQIQDAAFKEKYDWLWGEHGGIQALVTAIYLHNKRGEAYNRLLDRFPHEYVARAKKLQNYPLFDRSLLVGR